MNQIRKYWSLISLLGTDGENSTDRKGVILSNRISLVLGLISLFYIPFWAYQGNILMVSINAGLLMIYSGFIWLNYKKYFSIPKFFLIFVTATPIFVITDMLDNDTNLHFSLIPCAAFSVLLFNPKEKLKILLAVSYPMLLLGILLITDYKLFPNLVGEKLLFLPAFDYVINGVIILSMTLYLYRSNLKQEVDYKELYENHLKSQKDLDDERARSIYSSKLAAIGEMAGGIAHEINNPLFALRARIELLENSLSKKEGHEKELENILMAKNMLQKISDIIKCLSTISRNSEIDPVQNIYIPELIAETLIICNHRFYLKGIRIIQDLDPQMPKINCHPVELGQVLINILNNAYDALIDVKEPEIKIAARIHEGKAIITVENNGPSIPEEIRNKIFDSFYTTKAPNKGTGLGLSISQKLIEKNNGHLYLSPDKDRTKFVIELDLDLKKFIQA